MPDIVHIIGNGKSGGMFQNSSPGVRITCNIPPVPVEDAFATCMVDFKMMKAIHEGSVQVPAQNWVLGARPKVYMENNGGFHMRYAKHIRGFYTTLPDYVDNYTDFNCGHMATHYGVTKFAPKECHMYGFNSIFDFDMSSCTDMYLESDRSRSNNNRLANNWRGIWPKLFEEFPDTTFHLYHKHNQIKFDLPTNVKIITP